MRNARIVSALILLLGPVSIASAQSSTEWVQKRMEALARRSLAAEQMDRDKDVEPPSIAQGTSLVDQTDAPDLISLGMSLYDAASLDSGKAPITLTLSGWALRTAVTQQNPLNPSVYAGGGNWRRWSVTVGRELDEGTAGSARILGGKFLAWNARDLSSGARRRDIAAVNEMLEAAATKFAAGFHEIDHYLFITLRSRVTPAAAGASELEQKADFIARHLDDAVFEATVGLLTEEENERLDEIIGRLMPVDQALKDRIGAIVAGIRGAPQLALTYQARLRPDAGTDEHRWEAAFDYGPTDFLKLAVNGSYDIKQIHDADQARGGRVAIEFAWAATGRTTSAQRADAILSARRSEDKSAITLSVAGEVEWRSEQSSVRRLQGKVALPIPALKGITLPISVTWANDPALIDENDVRGQVGFTLDFSQMKRAMTSLTR